MTAYVVVDILVNDPAVFKEYTLLSPETLAKYGGRYLARGGASETLEGTWAPQRLVILEFESVEKAKIWYSSPEYTHAKSFRIRSADTQMVLVEGYTPPVI